MKKLSELIALRKAEQGSVPTPLSVIKARSASLIDFTDLTPLNQGEIDLYWPFEGSELERKIALRLATTRTAQETIKALTAKWSGTNAACHYCGKPKMKCDCMTYCRTCYKNHFKQRAHVCDPGALKRVQEENDYLSSIFASIRKV